MSLLSLLNVKSSQSYVSAGLSTAAQKVLDTARSTASAPSTSTQTATSQSDVSISAEALAAAQAKDDNAKNFAALSAEMRAALDAHYATAKDSSTPDLSALSGRAVAAIALNKSGAFSRSETQAARAEIRSRIQEEFANAGDITAFSSQIVSQYDAMSDEEREARGWSDSTRASASAFVQKATTPSLWDKLASDD